MTDTWLQMDPVALAAHRSPDVPALVCPEGVFSFQDLDQWVSGTARSVECHVEARRVGLVPSSSWESVVLLLALLRAGRTACLISSRWPPAAKALAVRQVGAEVVIEGNEAANFVQRGVAHDERSPFVLSMPATIVYTTGSTGEPKAALHSIGNHLYSARGVNLVTPLESGDRWLFTLPLYHVGGLGVVFRCLLAGATMVLPLLGESLHALLRRYQCTHVSLVGTQLLRILNEDLSDAPQSLKSVIVGGSSVAYSVLRAARVRGYPVSTTYGLTEMTSQVTTLPPDVPSKLLSSAGLLLPYRQLRISAEGEFQVKGETLFQGYVDVGRLHPSVDEDGWFSTGDLGHQDANGFLHVEGRKDNLFISGGENIVPEEIERALGTIEGVKRAVVVPVPDTVFGERPVAFVDGTDRWEMLREALAKTLPRFKLPVFRVWPASIPCRGSKGDRALLRQWARQESAESS